MPLCFESISMVVGEPVNQSIGSITLNLPTFSNIPQLYNAMCQFFWYLSSNLGEAIAWENRFNINYCVCESHMSCRKISKIHLVQWFYHERAPIDHGCFGISIFCPCFPVFSPRFLDDIPSRVGISRVRSPRNQVPRSPVPIARFRPWTAVPWPMTRSKRQGHGKPRRQRRPRNRGGQNVTNGYYWEWLMAIYVYIYNYIYI